MMQFIKDYGVVLIFVMQIAWFAITWWFRKSVATKDDVTAVRVEVSKAMQRIDSLEQARQNAPDKNDLAKLSLDMERMRGDMRTCTAEMKGTRDLFSSEADGLRQLVERTESMTRTLVEHALAKGH
ncbi:MAG: DUF2730 family protein [Gemmatimonadaceae bacterium]